MEVHSRVESDVAPPRLLSTAQVVAPLVGALFYGLGWMFFAGLSSIFDLNPEDIGVNFSFMVPRVALSLGIGMVLVAVLAYYGLKSAKVERFLNNGPTEAMGIYWLMVGLTGALYVASLVGIMAAFNLWQGTLLRSALAVLVAIFLFLITRASYRILSANVGESGTDRPARLGVLAVLIMVSLVVPSNAVCWYTGKAVGRHLHYGNSLDLRFVNFPRVRTHPAPPGAVEASCYLLMGRNGDEITLWEVAAKPKGNPATRRVVQVSGQRYDVVYLAGSCAPQEQSDTTGKRQAPPK